VSQISKAEEEEVDKRMNLNVPLSLHNAFKAATAAQGRKMTDVLLEEIERYTAKYGAVPSKKKKSKAGE
jgi:hypothetical protein